MKHFIGFLLLGAIAMGQSREGQQEAYRKWRETDSNLERDAITAGATLGARADKAAAASAQYFAARKAYLESLETDAVQKAAAVEAVTATPDADPNLEDYLSTQSRLLGSNIEATARVPDRGIQQLRQALERERTAIAAVTASRAEIRKIREAVVRASGNSEEARTQASASYQKLAASIRPSAQLAAQFGTAWGNYYRALSDAARSVAAPAISAASTGPPSTAAPGGASIASPAPVAATRALTPVPLSRYVGAWTYPTVGANYHGVQPEIVDLVVQEDNGRSSGTLNARFRLPGGGDPVVRFNFEGTFQNSRGQNFALTTSGGAKGTLELIPGPAFNLLEVNFSIEDKPDKVRQGNFLLIKK